MLNDIYAGLVSILLNRINLDGKCDDAEVCKDIAAYINMLPMGCAYGSTLWEFINDYGEDEDSRYLGRDAEGEKQYHISNPDTNWHERIRKELVAIHYYQRQNEYFAKLHEAAEVAA